MTLVNMAKEPQELKWAESLLPEDHRRKGMFGGFAYYLGDKIVLLTFEGTGSRSYRGQTYPFELWNGCMFPVEREHQDKALARFPFLVNHPILPKWLYLPIETEGFDELVSEVLRQATRPHGYWGSIPKGKSKKSARTRQSEIDGKMDTRTPRMFSDEPAEIKLTSVRKISDFKNLGPVTEAEFKKARLSAQQFIKIGWKKALVKLVAVNPKNKHSIFAYALIGALKNQTWSQISEADKKEARDFVHAMPKGKKK